MLMPADGAANGSAETPASAEPMDRETSRTSARSPFKCFSRKNLVFMYEYFSESVSREKLGGGPIMKASGVFPPLSGR